MGEEENEVDKKKDAYKTASILMKKDIVTVGGGRQCLTNVLRGCEIGESLAQIKRLRFLGELRELNPFDEINGERQKKWRGVAGKDGGDKE